MQTTGWKANLRQCAAAAGCAVIDAGEAGLGIEFSDGCDVLWLLPGEVATTLPIDPANVDVEAIWQAFQRLDELRGRVLHVIRHYLASVRIRATRSRCGQWGLETESGVSTSMSVGAGLTRRAIAGADVYTLVRGQFKGYYRGLAKPPTPKRIDRYLALEGPPSGEGALDARGEHEGVDLSQHTMKQTLAMIGLCGTLTGDAEIESADDLKRAAEPDGPLAQALLQFGERLPGKTFSADLFSGEITVDFTDALDSFRMSPKSRELARRVRAVGPIAAGDELADLYHRLDGARRQAMAAVARAAIDRGWGADSHGGCAFFGFGAATYLGGSTREVKVSFDRPLTDALRTQSIPEVLRTLLADAPDFAEACIGHLHNTVPDDQPSLPQRKLVPLCSGPQPQLPTLTASIVATLDELARDVCREHLESGLRSYFEDDHYIAETDTWATPADWCRLARQAAEKTSQQGWCDPAAIEVLLDQDNTQGRNLVLKYLDRDPEPHHEVSNSEVRIVWQFRHERPVVAAKWFCPSEYNDVPYATQRAALGDPVAGRFVRESESARDPQADVTELESNGIPADADGRCRLRDELIEWARNNWQVNPPPAMPLRIARRIGAIEVADALASNVHLLPMLLAYADRGERLDEPGLVLGADFVLAWSALQPTTLLAQLIAYALTTDALRTECARAHKAAAARNADVAKNASMLEGMYDGWLHELRTPLAIAWTRCRNAGVVPGER